MTVWLGGVAVTWLIFYLARDGGHSPKLELMMAVLWPLTLLIWIITAIWLCSAAIRERKQASR